MRFRKNLNQTANYPTYCHPNWSNWWRLCFLSGTKENFVIRQHRRQNDTTMLSAHRPRWHSSISTTILRNCVKNSHNSKISSNDCFKRWTSSRLPESILNLKNCQWLNSRTDNDRQKNKSRLKHRRFRGNWKWCKRLDHVFWYRGWGLWRRGTGKPRENAGITWGT